MDDPIFNKEVILKHLEEVMDPEIPVISVVDLGIIREVTQTEGGNVKVVMTPTFSGCPALHVMQDNIKEKLESVGFKDVEVEVSLENPWSTDDISQKGRKQIEEFGLGRIQMLAEGKNKDILTEVTCPHCKSDQTDMVSVFGSTLCRSFHQCSECKQTFERFKPL